MEPTALLSPGFRLAQDLITWALRRFSPHDAVARIEHRNRLKADVEARLRWIDRSGRYGEAIIRDVKRADKYPDVDPRAGGISAWFRVQLLGTYHRGILAGLGFHPLVREAPSQRWRLTRDYRRKDIDAILVGKIPYDQVSAIDWLGDENYGDPHIYCVFRGWRPSPYEVLTLCEEHFADHPTPHTWYTELATWVDAKRAARDHGERF